ncbi:MAG: hypothetical protein IT288_16930 [Bdellovibrionales bacterium]|nr:hypothetical protein [Bdellovibrionales bacterium]
MLSKIILGLLVVMCGWPQARAADSIALILSEALSRNGAGSSVGTTVGSTALDRVVPIQSLEYQYGADEGDSNQTHILRFNLKSVRELAMTGESQKLSQELNGLSDQLASNELRFLAHLQVVERILLSRSVALLSERQRELDRIVEKNLTLMTSAKSNAKELLRESLGAQQVQGELAALRGRLGEKESLDAGKAENLTSTLRSRAQRLVEKIQIAMGGQAHASLALQRKAVETRLERIDQEVKWADERKLVSHIDLRHDTENQDNSLRVGFNLPFVRFDRATQERESALVRAKETELEVERKSDQLQIESLLRQLSGSIEALKVAQSKLERMNSARKKLSQSKDIETLLAVKQSKFDADREVLDRTLDLYATYLGLLRELGYFAKMATTNFLDPRWAELK